MIINEEIFLQISSINIIGQTDYMWVDPIGRILVTAIIAEENPIRYVSEYYRYREVSSELVEVRDNKNRQWIEYPCKLDGGMVWWTINGKCHAWLITSSEIIPELVKRTLLKGRARLLELDKPTQ